MKRAAALLGIVALYFAAGRLGLSLATLNPSASPVWPPTGIALAAVLLLGPRVWPALLAGAFLVNFTTSGHVGVSLAIAAGNTLEGLVAGALVTRFAGGLRAFERAADVFRFGVLAGVLATAISATIGTTSLALAGFAAWSEYAGIWLTWWLGDAGGALVVAPPLLCWLSGRQAPPSRQQRTELAALLLAVLGIGTLVFVVRSAPGAYLCLPLTIWAAFRFGPREAATVVLAVSAFAVWGTLNGSGPAWSDDPNRALLWLQLFLGVISLTGLTLAALVNERARAHEGLERQARELARSNAELDAFAHVVSHDLKAPLRGITSLSTWIVEDCKDLLPGESAEHLRLLDQRAQRMSQLIDGVLAYSRVARTRTAPERVDANSVVAEVIDPLGATQATIRVEGLLPRVRYDRTQLVQVFQNLIGNSVQHMGREDGEVVVSCRERPEVFEFCVADNGVGIEEQHTDRIFRMFHALDPGRGTAGAGLTLVKKIVEMQGGAIGVEPTPGGGATFRFSVRKTSQDSRDGELA